MSVPFYGKEFTLTQPDGTQIQVRGWGDQRHAVFETLDGYTVVQDPITGFYQYATATDDREELIPTGVRPGMAAPEGLGLTRGVRISAAAARAKGEMCSHLPPSKSRWEIRRERHLIQKRALAMMPAGVAPAPPKGPVPGKLL